MPRRYILTASERAGLVAIPTYWPWQFPNKIDCPAAFLNESVFSVGIEFY